MPAGRGLALLADVPDRERRDGPPERVVRCKHSVISVPVLPRRRDEIGSGICGTTNRRVRVDSCGDSTERLAEI
jgi:hypothetical protein